MAAAPEIGLPALIVTPMADEENKQTRGTDSTSGGFVLIRLRRAWNLIPAPDREPDAPDRESEIPRPGRNPIKSRKQQRIEKRKPVPLALCDNQLTCLGGQVRRFLEEDLGQRGGGTYRKSYLALPCGKGEEEDDGAAGGEGEAIRDGAGG
jgi:hypothetical protein